MVLCGAAGKRPQGSHCASSDLRALPGWPRQASTVVQCVLSPGVDDMALRSRVFHEVHGREALRPRRAADPRRATVHRQRCRLSPRNSSGCPVFMRGAVFRCRNSTPCEAMRAGPVPVGGSMLVSDSRANLLAMARLGPSDLLAMTRSRWHPKFDTKGRRDNNQALTFTTRACASASAFPHDVACKDNFVIHFAFGHCGSCHIKWPARLVASFGSVVGRAAAGHPC